MALKRGRGRWGRNGEALNMAGEGPQTWRRWGRNGLAGALKRSRGRPSNVAGKGERWAVCIPSVPFRAKIFEPLGAL